MFGYARRGVKVVAMEQVVMVWQLKRIDAVDFNIAVLTNISDEHLDFMELEDNILKVRKNYFQCYLQIRLLF